MPSHPKPSNHRVLLGFDFGMKRIGVAVGQTITHSAQPLTILAARDGIPRWEEISPLIETWSADGLVVGIPYNMDNTPQNTTYLAQKFANRLAHRFKLPVYGVDERLSTVEAKSQLSAQTKRKPPREMDSYAAKLILESWLGDYAQGNE